MKKEAEFTVKRVKCGCGACDNLILTNGRGYGAPFIKPEDIGFDLEEGAAVRVTFEKLVPGAPRCSVNPLSEMRVVGFHRKRQVERTSDRASTTFTPGDTVSYLEVASKTGSFMVRVDEDDLDKHVLEPLNRWGHTVTHKGQNDEVAARLAADKARARQAEEREYYHPGPGERTLEGRECYLGGPRDEERSRFEKALRSIRRG